jgi:hypothetical protein
MARGGWVAGIAGAGVTMAMPMALPGGNGGAIGRVGSTGGNSTKTWPAGISILVSGLGLRAHAPASNKTATATAKDRLTDIPLPPLRNHSIR